MTSTEFQTRKTIAAALDHAAGRAGYAAATSKQCWFLASLLADLGQDAAFIDCGYANTQAQLTKKRASSYIDDLIARRDRKAA